MDVHTTDKPAEDMKYYLERGLEIASSVWSLSKKRNGVAWVPGDLIGPDGSDPATKAKSLSLISPTECGKPTDERRSITSAGHIPGRSRPNDVCVGWGEWDNYNAWQLHGRHLDKEYIPDPDPQPWRVDRVPPVTFEFEDGTKETVESRLNETYQDSRGGDPWTVREAIDDTARKRNQKTRQGETTSSKTKGAGPSFGGTHGRQD